MMENSKIVRDIINDVYITVILDKRKKRKDDQYPVAVRVCLRKERKYFSCDVYCEEKKWRYFFTTRVVARKNDARKVLNKFRDVCKCVELLFDSGKFSLANLEAIIKSGRKGNYKYVDEKISEIVALKEEAEKYNTAQSYRDLITSINECFGRRVKILDINKEFLRQYEQKMLLERHNNLTTIGIRLRSLRHVYNDLVKTDSLPKELNPFNDYKILSGKGRKMAISDDLLNFIKAKCVNNDHRSIWVKMWLLSYYMQGINVGDMLRLKVDNIDWINKEIRYVRKKTEERQINQKIITVPLSDNIINLLEGFCNLNQPLGTYLLPFLNAEDSERTIVRKISNVIRAINQTMQTVCGKEMKVTTYAARHTFATKMLRMGASTEIIRQCLGHSSVTVTENYLSDFDSSEIKKFTQNL